MQTHDGPNYREKGLVTNQKVVAFTFRVKEYNEKATNQAI